MWQEITVGLLFLAVVGVWVYRKFLRPPKTGSGCGCDKCGS